MLRRDFLGASLSLGALAALGGCAGTHQGAQSMTTNPQGVHYFSKFGVTEGWLAEALSAALSRGADFADVFVQHRVSTSMILEDGAVNRAFTSVDLGVGVRAVVGDQTGYGYSEDLSPESVRKAAQTAAAIASGPARQRTVGVPTVRKANLYAVKRGWEDVRSTEKLPLLQRVNERAFAADGRIKKVSVVMGDEYGAVLIADSEGRILEDLQPMTRLSLSIVAEQNGKRESNGYNVAARDGFDFYGDDRVARLIREAVARTMILFDASTPPAGEMPVVLGAGASGILLHEAIGHGMEADFNRKNTSIYADKLGKSIAKPFVNIVDDATVEHARGAINVDDEGNEGQRTMLVEGGVLASYMHDRISAKAYGVKPTGNGRRDSFRHSPRPRMRATYMLPGPHKEEEIIRSVKKGIYCSNFTNGQVQIGAGDFTFYVKNGYLIEDGKLTRPIKDVNIIGNGPKVLEKVDMVADNLVIDEGGWTCGKDGQGVPVSQGIPSVRVESITVGGRSA